MTAVAAEKYYRNMTVEWCRERLVAQDLEIREQYARLAAALEDNRKLVEVIKRTDDYVADLDRHGSIDRDAAFEIHHRLIIR